MSIFNLLIVVGVLGLGVLMPLLSAAEFLLTTRGGSRVGLILPGVLVVLAWIAARWMSWELFGGLAPLPWLMVFGLCCLPAAAVLAVYLVCLRSGQKRAEDELKRMEIQDL